MARHYQRADDGSWVDKVIRSSKKNATPGAAPEACKRSGDR